MPRRSSVLGLPPEVREWLEKALAQRGSGEYDELTQALNDQGYSISRSAVARYGKDFAEKVERVKLATDQARAVMEAAPDEEDALGAALARVVQSKLLDFFIDMGEIDSEKLDFAKLVASVASLNKTTISQKQHEAKVKAKAAKVAEEVADTAKAAGLSADTVKAIKAKILGVAA